MRVFVTGGAGFIGSHLVERLLGEGHSVRALVRNLERARAVLPQGVELLPGDIRDLDSLVKAAGEVDCVVHAAAHVSDWGAWSEFQATTVEGTENTLQAARRAGAKRFVLVSTTSVYDAAAVRSGHVEEDAPLTRDPSPGNRYGYAKALAEERAFAVHAAGTLEVTALRPAWVYGPRDRTLLPRILQFLRDPTSAWISGQDPEVGLVYVTDVCDAILRAATSPKASGLAFNVSAIEGYRMRELGERIAERTGLRSPTRSVPLWVARPLAALLEDGARLLRRKQPPSLTRYELSVMMEGNPWDVTRARALLGWEPKVSPAEGIARMMDWARAEGMV